MKKFVNDINESGDGEVRSEKTMLYLNSKIINVFCNGIDNETYLEMVELMVNAINTFPSHGSGCTVERIEKMSVSFAAFSPIQAVSYIHLPNSLKPVKQTFTKKKQGMIRNVFDIVSWLRTMIKIPRQRLNFTLLQNAGSIETN